jgi:putative molybdopterin biosynthesis protein
MVPTVQTLSAFHQLKLLADPRRLAILRRLLAGPATLTHLGLALDQHPARVRHHLKQLEQAGLVQLCDVQTHGGVVEKYYATSAAAFSVQALVLPEIPGQAFIIFAGSHDLALEALAETLGPHLHLLTMPIGSLDGLVALRQGVCHLAGCHLLDAASGAYNTPTVRQLFPDRRVKLITLAQRTQGLLLAPGNPCQVHALADLARPHLRLVSRNPGSGTRLWLDQTLARLGLPPRPAAEQVVSTHTAVAAAVQSGQADVGLGLEAAARLHGLDFLPLFEERYDLVLPAELYANPAYAPLFEALNSRRFRQSAEALGGYNLAHTGETVAV